MENVNLWTLIKINFRVTNFLVIINVLMSILTYALGLLTPLTYIILGAQILPGSDYPLSSFVLEPWRFITSAFLHGGLVHLLLNMYVLYSFGNIIEQYYGSKKLFLVYILSALGGSLLSFIGAFIKFYENNSIAQGSAISVGASGAVFGLVGLLLGYKFLKRKTYAPEIDFDEKTLIFFVGINLLFGFGVNALSTQVSVNNWAHLGGLISGILLGAVLNTKNTITATKQSKLFEKFLYYLALFLFFGSFIASFISGLNLFLTT